MPATVTASLVAETEKVLTEQRYPATPLPGSDDPSLIDRAPFGLDEHPGTDQHFAGDAHDMPYALSSRVQHSPGVKKVPMSALPSEPVNDQDGGSGAPEER
jgi:hypothetical protein